MIDIHENSTPEVVLLLRKHGVSNLRIARELSLHHDTVAAVLDLNRFDSVKFRTVERVRQYVTNVLDFMNEDTRNLWDAYKVTLEDAA